MSMLRNIIDKLKGEDLHQNLNAEAAGSVCAPESAAVIRRAGAECAVLLKNEKNTLPLEPGKSVAVFGRAQIDWFYMGYGSGGDVRPEHKSNLMEGLEQDGITLDPIIKSYYADWCAKQKKKTYAWGEWPSSLPETPIGPALIAQAASRSETALIVIGRCAGEDLDFKDAPGSYRLTKEELNLITFVSKTFKKTVLVLNTSGMTDLTWMSGVPGLTAVLVCWHGGQESGLAAADALTGRVCPSGKLTATWAPAYAYPGMEDFLKSGSVAYREDNRMGYRWFDTRRDMILYPFGFGLSYTKFGLTPGAFGYENGHVSCRVTVKNTGNCPGKEAPQLYIRPPEDAPLALIDFKKTKLLAPGEEETLTLSAEEGDFASFEEEKHAFILRAGEYRVFLGTNALTENEIGRFALASEHIVKEVPPLPDGSDFVPPAACKKPAAPVTMADVKAGKASVEELLACLSEEELEFLSRGEGNMNSPLGVPGNAGAMGGTVASLREKGIRPLITSDGPSGLRLKTHASLFPCGTLLASGFDEALTEEVLGCLGREAKTAGADIVLGPGLNLQRNPMNGRNFEYFSEDPILSGRMAAAAVRGLQSTGVAACPKHFCCNNKENGRKYISSDVSERALRELYLKSFSVMLRYCEPLCLMTSYNRINGVSACYHYPLVTGVLRREWGYKGLIMSDWWMIYEQSPYFKDLRDNPARVRAGVNVLMPGNRSIRDFKVYNDKETVAALKKGTLTRAELEQNAKYVLELQLKLDGD